MACSTAAGIGAFAFAYLQITPVFEASTSLLAGQGVEAADGSRRQSELVTSQARVAESSEVIRDAISRVGQDSFAAVEVAKRPGLGGWFRQVYHELLQRNAGPAPVSKDSDFVVSDIDVLAAQLGRTLFVRTEPNSEVIKIVFQYPDPKIAPKFANALAESFIMRQLSLAGTPGAVDFFEIQKKHFNDEVQKRSQLLEDFSRRERMYSIEDQRSLLLKRASDLSAALTNTRGALADKLGQKATLVAQLRLLKPVTQSPFVSNLVETLGTDHKSNSSARASSEKPISVGDPPLLMVRVYQDSMVTLFKINAELAGLQDLAKQQEEEVGSLNKELATLSAKQTSFERLKRDVAQATVNAELYSKRATEEQINADLRSAKLTNLRVIQRAFVPFRAVFPNGLQFLALGILSGALVGLCLSLLSEALKPELALQAADATSASPGPTYGWQDNTMPVTDPPHGTTAQIAVPRMGDTTH